MNQNVSVENELSLNGLRDRSLSLFQNTREASLQLVDRTQRIATEWLSESERRLLQNVSELLRELDAKISERLSQLGSPSSSGDSRDEARAEEKSQGQYAQNQASQDQANEDQEALLPLPGYDSLNAKAAISAIADLNAEMLEAIRLYEEATKNRATVLRAIDQRLAS